ncbi:MAG TPA: cytidyltransferase [Elusimicrobia bacterium]|nr:cytidyltransferase [Elusimicrobiota bacterium]
MTAAMNLRPTADPKIKTLKELACVLAKARKVGKTVALCHGVFDLMHPGHVVHFREARAMADILVVTLTPDRLVNKGPGRPIFNQQLRLDTIAALRFVDYVALNDGPTAVETINKLKPNFYVKGSDYADQGADLTGKISDEEAAVRAIGGSLKLTRGFRSSSSTLINRFFSAYPEATQEYLHRMRRKRSSDEIVTRLKGLSDLRPLVVGEAILDEYFYCIPLGKTPKDTIVATKFASMERFAGGAVATANHLAGFCREVTLLTTLGPDSEEEEFLRSKLRPNVRMDVLRTPDRPTVRKRRFIEPNFMTKMFEIQYLDDSPIEKSAEAALGAKLQESISRHDFVIANDFGHGMLTPRLRLALSRSRKFLALNTQSNSANHGFNPVTNYPRADYVAIDGPELQLAARSRYGDLREESAKLRKTLKAATFLVSLGHRGSAILSGHGWEETPALATRIIDRTGAGDALFAVTSPCVYRGFAPDLLGLVANCVGAMAVEIVGNRESVEPTGLYRFIQTLLK